MESNGQLYYGGEILTMDDRIPSAQAVAVKDGKILAVGSESECRSALDNNFEEVNLAGRALLPGFIDTHFHPVLLIYFEMNLNLLGTRSLQDLKEKFSRAPAADSWLVGLNFDEQGMDEPKLPSRHDLDDACPGRPAVIIKHDGHMLIANTKAIEAAKISAATPDPEGGRIDREKDGFPAGLFRELAVKMILDAMPMPDLSQFLAAAERTAKKLCSFGITSAGAILQTDEQGPAGAQGKLDLLAMQLFQGKIPINLYSLLIANDVEKILAAKKTKLHGEIPGLNRIGGIKLYADGTFGSATAFMYKPFTDQPDQSGFMVNQPEWLYALMVSAHKAGLQIATHAIGDQANRICADLYERLLREYPKQDHRHRLEHGSIMDQKTIDEIARLGVIVSTQPMFIHSEKHWLHKRLGPERAKMVYPLRSFLDAGVKVAGASDAPVESAEVLHAISCCVTREGFETRQAITAREAIRMFTLDAAYAQFEDSVKGSISPGKRADLVILSHNPASVPPEKIRALTVEGTIIGGKTVFERK